MVRTNAKTNAKNITLEGLNLSKSSKTTGLDQRQGRIQAVCVATGRSNATHCRRSRLGQTLRFKVEEI